MQPWVSFTFISRKYYSEDNALSAMRWTNLCVKHPQPPSPRLHPRVVVPFWNHHRSFPPLAKVRLAALGAAQDGSPVPLSHVSLSPPLCSSPLRPQALMLAWRLHMTFLFHPFFLFLSFWSSTVRYTRHSDFSRLCPAVALLSATILPNTLQPPTADRVFPQLTGWEEGKRKGKDGRGRSRGKKVVC